MFGALARAVTRRPWLVIIGWLLVAAAIIVSAPRISSVTTSDRASFLPGSSESARAEALAKKAFPAADGATGVIVIKPSGGGILNQADLARVGDLANRLAASRIPAVAAVAFDPTQMVARNQRVAMVAVQFTGPAQRSDVQGAVTRLRTETGDTLRGSRLSAGMTGDAAIAVDNTHAFNGAEKIVTIATVALIVTLLLLIFRSPIAALLPLATIGLGYGISISLVAVGGHLFGFHVGQELPVMLTVVLFGIGTDYILFLLFRYRERLRAGDPPGEAIITAVTRIGETIASAAFAVIAAFGALALAALGFFTTLGPALAVGVAVLLLAALTLVPAVVAVLGRWVFWPARSAVRRPAGTRFAAVGRLVARWPVPVVAGSLALLAGLSIGIGSFRPDYDPITQLPGRTEATRAFHDLQLGFPAGALNPTEVYLTGSAPIQPTAIASFTARLASVEGVATPGRPEVSADGRTVRVPLILTDAPYSDSALTRVDNVIREQARAAAPASTSVLVGGQTMAYADVRDTTNRDLRLILPIAGLLFVLILGVVLRAVAAPVYLVAMVVGGFTATLGTATWLFAGLSSAGVTFTIPIVLYLFVTAIGTDYNILVTTRLREEIREGRGSREAARLAIEHAGPSVAAAGAILAGTFASLLISGVPFFMQIGFAVTLGIVLVAFVVSMLLVPATTALLGSGAWWPGRSARPGGSSGRDAGPDLSASSEPHGAARAGG